MTTRTVTWGEALVVEQFKYPGGLRRAVGVIQDCVGTHIGARATFHRLLRVEDPAGLGPKDQLRAWLLLATFGHDPGEWGIPDDVVPKSMNAAALRDLLSEPTVTYPQDESSPAAQRYETAVSSTAA